MSREVDIDAAVRRAKDQCHEVDIDAAVEATSNHSRSQSFNEVDIDAVVARSLSTNSREQDNLERSHAETDRSPNGRLVQNNYRQLLVVSQHSEHGLDIASAFEHNLQVQDNQANQSEQQSPDALSLELLELAEKKPTEVHQTSRMQQLVWLQHLNDDAVENSGTDPSEIRTRATMALSLAVEQAAEDSYEQAVWDLLQHIWAHCELLRQQMSGKTTLSTVQHGSTTSTMSELMRLSFEPSTKPALCCLGALQSLLSLLHLDHLCHPQVRSRTGMVNMDAQPAFHLRSSMRVHVCTVLCNLMKGDMEIKEMLATTNNFLEMIKQHLDSPVEELVRVSGVLLQNISFHVNEEVKVALADANLIPSLVQATSTAKHRNTVLNLTSALWNMSAHSYKALSGNNKAAFCQAPGSLELLVRYLDTRDEDQSSVQILHNVVGILQNISSYIARQPMLCAHLRHLEIYNVLARLLRRRKVPVAIRNACGALWNLSGASDDEREAIRVAKIVPLLEMLERGGSDDEKTIQNAHHTLLNLKMTFYPQQLARYSPSGAEISSVGPFPSGHHSYPEKDNSAVMDSELLHKEVPGRISQRRQQRMEQIRRSRDDVFGAHSPNGFFVSTDNLRNSSSESVADRKGSRNSVDSLGFSDAPQKPPRLRHGTSSSEASPRPFFRPQAQLSLEARRMSHGTVSQEHIDSWHARSQSDSAASFTLPLSNHLRRNTTSNRDHLTHTSNSSSSVGSSSSLRAPYTSSPHRSPRGSQDLSLSTPLRRVPSPNRLGSLGELTIREQTQV